MSRRITVSFAFSTCGRNMAQASPWGTSNSPPTAAAKPWAAPSPAFASAMPLMSAP